MVAARILLAVAALNLLFLGSELAMNVFRAYSAEEERACWRRRPLTRAGEPGRIIAFFGGAVVYHRLLRLGRVPRKRVGVAGFSAPGVSGRTDRSVMTSYLVVFAAGFAGSFHCLGMCGGLRAGSAAIRAGAARPRRRRQPG